MPCMLADELARRVVQIAGTAIVAETFPKPQDFLRVRRGKVRNCGKGFDESLKVRNDDGGLRLLQHHLADPDAIRIAVLPPRKVATMSIEPSEEPLAQ